VFKRIEATNYRCLKDVKQELNPFEILVGANASGKSTFLDTINFLSDFFSYGLDAAVEARTANFRDLIWSRAGDSFQFGAWVMLPYDKRSELSNFSPAPLPSRAELCDQIRYLIEVRFDPAADRLFVAHESVILKSSSVQEDTQLPAVDRHVSSVTMRDELSLGEIYVQVHSHNNSSLASLPSDARFPGTSWLREQFKYGVRAVELSGKDLSKPSPPGTRDSMTVTGSGLARQVAQLKDSKSSQFPNWLAHVRTALPDIRMVNAVLREYDNHVVLDIEYENGLRLPSWMLSEGTLRLLALTILAYLPSFQGVYLIEEPENGVHPTALNAIYQSLSSVYGAQVLVTSHSPVLLSMASPNQILCFSNTSEGTKIVRGDQHPALRDWQGEVSLGTMAASGILG